MRNLFLLLMLPILGLASVSCTKEITVDSKMESIAGVYTLRASLDKSWTDFSAYGYGSDNPPTGTIEKKNGGWYFNYLFPYPQNDGTFDFVNVEQPMTWNPILNAYCFIGTKLAGPDFSSIGTSRMYYDEASHKFHYGVYDHNTEIYLYVWTKK